MIMPLMDRILHYLWWLFNTGQWAKWRSRTFHPGWISKLHQSVFVGKNLPMSSPFCSGENRRLAKGLFYSQSVTSNTFLWDRMICQNSKMYQKRFSSFIVSSLKGFHPRSHSQPPCFCTDSVLDFQLWSETLYFPRQLWPQNVLKIIGSCCHLRLHPVILFKNSSLSIPSSKEKRWICPNTAGAFRERSDLELQEIRCQSIATCWEWKFYLFGVYFLSTENLDVLLNIMKLRTTLVWYLLKRLSIPWLSILYASKKSQQQESPWSQSVSHDVSPTVAVVTAICLVSVVSLSAHKVGGFEPVTPITATSPCSSMAKDPRSKRRAKKRTYKTKRLAASCCAIKAMLCFLVTLSLLLPHCYWILSFIHHLSRGLRTMFAAHKVWYAIWGSLVSLVSPQLSTSVNYGLQILQCVDWTCLCASLALTAAVGRPNEKNLSPSRTISPSRMKSMNHRKRCFFFIFFGLRVIGPPPDAAGPLLSNSQNKVDSTRRKCKLHLQAQEST